MAAIRPRARRVPRREHRGDRAVELLPRVLREVAPGLPAADPQRNSSTAPRSAAASRSTSATDAARALGPRRARPRTRRSARRAPRWSTSARTGGTSRPRTAVAGRVAPVPRPTADSARGSGSCPSSPASTPASPSAPRREADRRGRRGSSRRSAPRGRPGASDTSSDRPSGHAPPPARYARQAPVVTVNPSGPGARSRSSRRARHPSRRGRRACRSSRLRRRRRRPSRPRSLDRIRPISSPREERWSRARPLQNTMAILMGQRNLERAGKRRAKQRPEAALS